MGVCSFIFLFGIIVFWSKLTIKSPAIRDFSFLTTEISAKPSNQNLFIGSINNTQKDSLNMVFLQQNSAIGVIPPVIITPKILGVLINENEFFLGSENENRRHIFEYTVEPNDTLFSVAEKFNISTNTILWANDLNKGSALRLGQKLIILPVSGVLYNVKDGDTLDEISKIYKGDINEIIAFNELPDKNIFIGDILIIPNGEMPSPSKKYIQSQSSQIPTASNYFIYPTEGRISQGLHFSNAIDIANKCGTLVVAAAGGKILRTGWNSVGGNYITISHPNGTVTYYGHLSSFLVKAGESINVGQAIGTIGITGRTTGCHLHFGIRGARNFLENYPLGAKIKWEK